MMLALESARAIGCHIGEDSFKSIERGEPQAIRQLVMDIVRVNNIVIIEIGEIQFTPYYTGKGGAFTKYGR